MSRKVLHIISQAHLDPVWLWPQRDGIAAALTTMQSAVDRAAEFPQFRFTRSSAAVYRWAQEMDPVLFESIQQLVAEGRWEVVGGMIEQPDCNLPSAESFLRQSFYAKDFFQKAFGEAGDTKVAYVPDSFGHAAGLPQILNLGGFDSYVFMRPQPVDGISLPLLFNWKSDDGSTVLGIRIPIQYSQSYAATADDIETVVRSSATEGFAPGFLNGAMWFGVGNHGGGPTREHIERILQLQSDDSLPEIRFSTVREFIAAVRAEAAYAQLPVVNDELQFVFRGCYAATGETKRQNRHSEKKLFAAESLAAMAGQTTYLNEAWWQLGYNQFHDILAGTCVLSAQEPIRDSFGKILTAAEEQIERAAFQIARSVDTRHETGSVLTVVNPYPSKRHATVELDTFKRPHGREEIVGFEDSDGKRYPVQWTQAEANFGPWGLPWAKLTATLPVPACGHQTFKVLMADTGEIFQNPFSGEENAATEQFRKTEQSETRVVKGEVVPAFDSAKTAAGTNLLAGSPKFHIIDDPSSTWGHGVKAYNHILAELEFTSVEKIISGEVLSVTRHRAQWDKSEMLLDVRQHHVSGLIELHVRFNWQQQRQMLKLAFPTVLENPSTLALNAGSVVTRPADGSEYPCHDWAALKGEYKGEASWLAVANDATYGFSSQDGKLSFTLARGVPLAEHPPFEYEDTTDLPFLDQGWQEKRFWLQADSGDWQQHQINGWAHEVQVPPVAILDSGHPGNRSYRESMLEVDTDALLVHAFEPRKDKEAHMLRIQEIRGTTLKTVIRYQGKPHLVELKPWQIATVELLPELHNR